MEDGGNGSHNPREHLGRGCETEAEDPELERPSSLPRSEDNDANRDEQEPAGRRPAGPGETIQLPGRMELRTDCGVSMWK